jgi:hypothetical protein
MIRFSIDIEGKYTQEMETDDKATAQQFADRYIKGKWPKDEINDNSHGDEAGASGAMGEEGR